MQSLLGEMLRAVEDNCVFQDRMQITSPMLRAWFGLAEGDELWHRVQITRMHDPIQQRPLLCVCQVDISDVVEVEKQVVLLQQQQASLLREILPQQVACACMCLHAPACNGSACLIRVAIPTHATQ